MLDCIRTGNQKIGHIIVLTSKSDFLVPCANSYLNCGESGNDKSKICVSKHRVCDGNYDCVNNFDESDALCKGKSSYYTLELTLL